MTSVHSITAGSVESHDDSDVVMVTGGSGFLGQHIISLLHQRADYVKEIRCLDIKPYKNKLGHAENKQMKLITGCVTDLYTVRRSLAGVKSVFHIAGLVSFGMFPDIEGMNKVNIEGTANIIDACLGAGVERLIYCSTVDVVIGFKPITNGSEQNTSQPQKFLFPGYPESKAKAESLVLSANGKTCRDGKTKLRTISLRVNVMYGEGDPYYVTNGLRSAQKLSRTLLRVGDGSALFQPVYVGNTAWAFLCADKTLRTNSGVQNVFFVPDDTRPQNTFCFIEPYLQNRGFSLSTFYLPYRLVYWCLYFLEILLWAISPIVKINMSVVSCSIRYINTDLYFSFARAQSLLGYKPLYTPEESYKRAMHFYKNVKL